MPRRVLRAVLFAVVTMALWSIARPAMAMPAGFCDDRGATAVAAEPTLDATDGAVLQAVLAAGCGADEGARTLLVALAPAHGGTSIAASASDPALPLATLVVLPASGSARALTSETTRAPSGVRSGIDRPPRG